MLNKKGNRTERRTGPGLDAGVPRSSGSVNHINLDALIRSGSCLRGRDQEKVVANSFLICDNPQEKAKFIYGDVY